MNTCFFIYLWQPPKPETIAAVHILGNNPALASQRIQAWVLPRAMLHGTSTCKFYALRTHKLV